MADTKAAHHRGEHDTLSRLARSNWHAQPDTTCVTCGLTRAEGIAKWGKQGEWDAGHKRAGTIARTTLDYQPQHAHCNRSEGATQGNRNREPHSERW